MRPQVYIFFLEYFLTQDSGEVKTEINSRKSQEKKQNIRIKLLVNMGGN